MGIMKRKLFFLTIIFFVFNTMSSQNFVDSLNFYYQKKDFNKAINYGQITEKYFENKSNLVNTDYAYTVFLLATMFGDNYELGKDYYSKTLNVYKPIYGDRSYNYSSILLITSSFYQRHNDFKNALLYYNEFIEISKEIKNKDDIDLINSEYNLAFLYFKNEKYLESEKLYLGLIDLQKSKLGVNNFNYFLTISGLANLYYNEGKYLKSEKLFTEAIEIIKKIKGDNSKEYLTTLAGLALVYSNLPNFKKAKVLFEEVIEKSKKKIGDNDFRISISINNLANLYIKTGNYNDAEQLYNNSLNITKQTIGEENLEYLITLNNIANLYDLKGEFFKALKLNEIILNKSNKLLKANDPFFGTIFNNIANAYFKIGNTNEATEYFLKTIEFYKLNQKEDNPLFATALSNLGNLYETIGKFSEAEQFLLESINIRKNILGVNHPDYATSLTNLGKLYQDNGDFTKAEHFFLLSLNIRKKIFGEEHTETANSIANLGVFYGIQKDYTKAELFSLKSAQIRKKNLGEYHPLFASSLNNIGYLYYTIRDYDKAIQYFEQAILIKKKIFGESHFDYALSLGNLGNVYESIGQYSKSEKLQLQAFNIYEKNIGLIDANYENITYNLIILYTNWGKDKKAIQYISKTFKPFKNQIIEASSYLSENELGLFRLNKFNKRFLLLSFLNKYPTQYLEINNDCYETELLVKNLSLRNQQYIKTSIEKSGDTLLQDKYEQFIEDKRYLTKLEELPGDKRPTSYEQLIVTTEALEKELVRQSTAFADAKKSLSVNWKQIQEKLKPNEIAIDLVAFNYYNKKWTDSIVYSAFVVGKDFKAPKYIPLFEQKQLEFLLAKNKNEKDTTKIDNQYADKLISDLFLKPLEKELNGITSIYLSPTGLGHQINFSALPVSETQTLGEKYQVHILGSTAEIVNYKVAHLDQKTKLELLLYGNIDYNKNETTSIVTNDTLTNNNSELAALITRSSATTKFNFLAGSKIEINKINTLAKQNNFASIIIDDKKASEESIKLLDGRKSPFVLHLATHGFFFPDPKQELPKEDLLLDSKSKIFKTADDPMVRSGLLFAGANKYWGKPTENTITDDGILTASEISNLDLSSCQLVVLSACETGLGEINGSEGVFGLQRAFKMAGVKNIIMSLWKVPDAQTAELFDIFYSECFSGKTIHEAFQSAQAKMKVKYSPYYWAGFVLLE